MAIPINIKGATARHGGGVYFTCLDTLFLTKPKQGVAISHAWPFFRTKPKQGHLFHIFGHFFSDRAKKEGIYFIRTEPKRRASISHIWLFFGQSQNRGVYFTCLATFFGQSQKGGVYFNHFVSDKAKKDDCRSKPSASANSMLVSFLAYRPPGAVEQHFLRPFPASYLNDGELYYS